MEADGFRDRNQRYGYLVARENARRILADPAVLEAGRRHLERFAAGDPHQRTAMRCGPRCSTQAPRPWRRA